MSLLIDSPIQEMIQRAARNDKVAQAWLCNPENNPDAAAFFIFNFCYTQDEERGGAILRLPPPIHPANTPKTPWYGPGEPSWALKWVEALDAPRPCKLTGRNTPHNIHDEKSRRMLHTWIACHYNLWALMWVRGYSSLLISQSEDHVDDGGRDTTKVFSMFSRMKFAWDKLPAQVRKHIDFTYMSAVCSENDAHTKGKAPTEHAGRGGGVVRAFVDECAFIDYMASIHTALDPACKFGKVYMGTVNGPDNLYAEIKKKRYEGWRFFECDWKEDPDKTVGIRETEPGPERERYGSHVSPWFATATASLRDEKIAQEYGRNYDKSTGGMIYREFSKDIHVRKIGNPRGPLLLDPSLEVRVGLDPGHARKCAATVIQPVGTEFCRVIGSWEGIHRSAGENAVELRNYLRELGFNGDLEEIVMVPDPASLNEEIGSGLELYSWFRAAGFVSYQLPMIVGPDSVYLGNNVVRALFQRNMIEIDEEHCKSLLEAIPAYKLPVDRKTNMTTSNKPVHNMASHPCDSFRYAITSVWTADDVPYDGFISVNSVRQSESDRKNGSNGNGSGNRIVDGRLHRSDDDSDDERAFFAPIVQTRRKW